MQKYRRTQRMTTHYDNAIDFVLKREGRGTTKGSVIIDKWGIELKHHPEARREDFTVEDAKLIYYKKYWTPMKCETAMIRNHYNLCLCLFDAAVNMGKRRSTYILQHSLNQMLTGHTLRLDGIFGEHTLSAISAIITFHKIGELTRNLMFYRCLAYNRIVQKRQSKNKYLHGWLNRVELLEREIKQ